MVGSATSTMRSPGQTDTSRFFSANSATMVGDALVRYLETHPVSLEDTAWMFAAMHGAMTDSIIKCWRLKRDVGFWRPGRGHPAGGRGREPRHPAGGWLDAAPGTCFPVLRLRERSRLRDLPQVDGHPHPFYGDTMPLELRSASSRTAPRTYATLSQLEFDALNSRIWGGLHFRDAMSDAYAIGRRTARAVMQKLR